MEERPVRKKNRLEGYDYAKPGYYFVTFCTKNKECTLGSVTTADEANSSEMRLSPCGQLTQEAIVAIEQVYPGVKVDQYAIMPNHVHLLLSMTAGDYDLPNLSRIIQQTKRRVSKNYGSPVWQSHYNDHIIRCEQDYREIWEYIENNPTKLSLYQQGIMP